MKMRTKILLAVLLLLSLFLVIHGGAISGNISCEFQEARDIAMSAPADSDGDHIAMTVYVDQKSGNKIGYGVCYFLKDNAVSGIIVSGDRVISVLYFEDADYYMVETGNAITGQRYSFQEIPKEKAILFMRNVLKRLTYRAIPQ
jgi:hypothetical protein